MAFPCDTVKLPGSLVKSIVPLTPGNRREHLWETRGYGKNLLNRDNGQPSPKVLGLWVQFTD